MTKRVTLVVVDRNNQLRGELAPFDVPTPWWQEVGDIVAAVPDVTVLRLLEAERAPDHPMGGSARYLVESEADLDLRPVEQPVDLDDHPLRMPWARPGGPRAALHWAAGHIELAGSPVQHRTWNLSAIWRLPMPDGAAWLKWVPPFFGHEGTVLHRLSNRPVPQVVASDGQKLLLAAMPGVDGYGAGDADRRAIVDELVAIQHACADRADDLGAAGVPDWRRDALRERATALLAERPAPRSRQLLDHWDERWDAVEACGLPTTLFHGDAHPGNARVGLDRPILFDWGDSGIGHPLYDLVGWGAANAGAELVDHWFDRWTAAVPGCDPKRAFELIGPIALLRSACVYQRFLDHIEPSERIYHREDPATFVDRTERLLGPKRPGGAKLES